MGFFRGWPRWLKWLKWASVLIGVALGLLLLVFPGRRLGLAFTLATGLGRQALQARIDRLEANAIRRAKPSADDSAFLLDFYGTLATGGKLSVVIGQTGKMMDHYLAGTGADYRLDPVIFTGSRKVQAQAAALRESSAGAGCRAGARLSSPAFYMPDESNLDSVFGLYHGTLQATQSVRRDGSCRLHFRAEVPWVWPTYSSLAQKYGDPHAESFPLPNLQSLVLGQEHALFVDNGLGGYLAEIGLAKPFLAFAEWSDPEG
jgi:hypothetical protein